MTSELEEMACLLASKNKEINDVKVDRDRLKRLFEDAQSRLNTAQQEIKSLKKQVESPYNQDAIKALMDAHEMLRAENKDLHRRADAAFAGVAMDASAKKHYLQSIVERLDGIKASVEVVLKE